MVEGEPPAGGVLIAFKHESFFEAIDLPCLLDYPAPFAKEELLRIPLGPGRARLRLGRGRARPGRQGVARDADAARAS